MVNKNIYFKSSNSKKKNMTKIIYDTITKIFTFFKKKSVQYLNQEKTPLEARLQPGGGRF